MSPDSIQTPIAPIIAEPARSLTRVTPRVAVVCDFLEENWPSMDLNGDLLDQFLTKEQAGEISSIQLRPPFQKRFTRGPLASQSTAWNADRLANRFVDYPRWLAKRVSDFDLFHVVDHSYSHLLHGLPKTRSIVTCHDLDTFRCVLDPHLEKRPLWFRAMANRILSGFRQAAHVICNSNATRERVLHFHLLPPDRVTVIHSGVHPAFQALADAAADAEADRLIQSNWPAGGPWLLNVGSTIPRKRVDTLLHTFALVLEQFPDARLIRVGGPFTEPQQRLAQELKVEGAILSLPFISRQVLASIYRRVTLLLQPSEAEGFGMPVAEAMACGCLVVASDLPALREVGGAAGVYCPVGDISSWRQAVLSLLEQSAQAGGAWLSRRREQSQAQVAQYSWSENARRTVAIYRQVLGLSD